MDKLIWGGAGGTAIFVCVIYMSIRLTRFPRTEGRRRYGGELRGGNVMSDTMTAHRKRGHGYPRQLLICDKWNPGNATGVGIVCPSGRPANYGVASNKLQPKTPTRFYTAAL
ncbi:hypothetical protein ALC56_11435 [Trachymyrmex septentrionalis]|uniref:Uncharacterized protein n=1 Tax=Trachymyrmex septentrionalis TaxID=34720 RepID=A0A195F1I3_9HYME|nr:hypothetical protein ALC56_11435 [Trachymyrmex septentrionalis]